MIGWLRAIVSLTAIGFVGSLAGMGFGMMDAQERLFVVLALVVALSLWRRS